MSGTVNVSRGLFDDTAFKAEPMTEREAFLWLVMEARWKAGEKRIGSEVFTLERGQLAVSVRFLASAWQWTKSRTDRYLSRLQSAEMIQREIGTAAQTITICNYDKYQGERDTSRDSGGTRAGHNRDSSGTNEKKGEIKGKEGSFRAARFGEFWEAYPHRGGTKRGRKVAEAKYLKAVADGTDEQLLIDAARRYVHDRQVMEGYAKNPETWLHQQCWNDEIERVQPKVIDGKPQNGALRVTPNGRVQEYALDGWIFRNDLEPSDVA